MDKLPNANGSFLELWSFTVTKIIQQTSESHDSCYKVDRIQIKIYLESALLELFKYLSIYKLSHKQTKL